MPIENLYRCPICSHELRAPAASTPVCQLCLENARMEWIPEAAPLVKFRGNDWQTKVPIPGGGWTDRGKPKALGGK